VEAPADICTPTVISTLLYKITVNTPFFGVVFYCSQWAFILVFVLGFIYSSLRPPTGKIDMDELDDLMAEEEEGLLDSFQRRATGVVG